MTKFSKNCEIIITSSPKESSVAYPDLELKGRRGFLLLAPPAFHPSAILLFLSKTKGGPGPPEPLP